MLALSCHSIVHCILTRSFRFYCTAITKAGSSAAIPFIFEALAEFEEWETGLFVIEITVVRSIVEKVAVFIFFILAIQSKIADYACWETSVGQLH